MRAVFTLLLSGLSMMLWAQANHSCNYGKILENYNKLLPVEKVYAQTDRSFYEPGETIWFKAYLLDEALQAKALSNQLRAELIDPIGNKAAEIRLKTNDGQSHGDFTLAQDAAGGIYQLRVYTIYQQNFGEELVYMKDLTVQRNIFPNVLMKLDFVREAYGPGSEVSASFQARKKDNSPLAGLDANYNISLAGKSLKSGSLKCDASGSALLQFNLPDDLKTADGLLNISLEVDGRTESISRSIPIVTRNIKLDILPEGGDLILGTTNNVAFKAVDEFGKPVDFKAHLLNDAGQLLQKVESYHQGMGAFLLTTQKNENYQLKIVEPAGIDQRFPLPKSLKSGVGMRLEQPSSGKLKVNVFSSKEKSLCVVVQMQGKVVDEIGVNAKKGDTPLEIATDDFPMGIAQITIFDEQEIPQTERLVFLHKERQLKIDVKMDKKTYQIRDSVLLDIQVTDETGKGVAGNFSLAVVDDKVWTFADDKQDNILSYLLMSSDLKGKVYEPEFYFNPKEEKANKALDFVMLTHGWRRYSWRALVEKNAAKKWAHTRQHEPEPATALAGQLMAGDKELSNALIHVKVEKSEADYKGPKTIKTDKNGKFYVPDFNADCKLQLVANYRGIKGAYRVANRSNMAQRERPALQFQPKPFRRSMRKNNVQHRASKDYRNSSSGVNGQVRGLLTDAETGEPLLGAAIRLLQNGEMKYAAVADINGWYQINNIAPGNYELKATFIGFNDVLIKELKVLKGKLLHQNISFSSAVELLEVVEITANKQQLALAPQLSVTTLDRETIQQMPTRNVQTIATTVSGVSTKGARRAENNKMTRKDRNLELPQKRAKGFTDLNDQVQLADQKNRRRMAAPNFKETRAARNTRQAIVNKTTVQTSSRASENSNLLEMSRLKGEAPNFRSKDKNFSQGANGITGPNRRVYFKMEQVGQPSFYQAKTFYAPDYSAYLKVVNSGELVTPTRSDFRNTIFWQPYLKTNEQGQAKLHFFNSDATTTFRIVVEGLGQKGKVGRVEKTYAVQMPFELDVKMPKILTFGDTLRLPVVLRNSTTQALLGELNLQTAAGLECLLDSIPKHYELPANGHLKIEIPYLVKPSSSKEQLVVNFLANGMNDQLLMDYELRAKGFPASLSLSGKEIVRSGQFNINDLVDGSLNARLEVYTSVLQDLQSSMEALLRQPSGCFEQVSSSTYPNIMALKVMKATNSLQPAVFDRATGYINQGYKKLAGYESNGGGFEWFGKSPAHEGLTAYGLMEFKDMEEVYPFVDQAMVARARKFLLSRKDGRGGFQVKTGYNHGWGNSQAVSNAYITYALSYIGEKGLNSELANVAKEATASKDLYRLALATLAHFNAGHTQKAEELLTLLNKSIDQQGLEQMTAEHSITYSRGTSLKAEILGLACLALLEAQDVEESRLRSYIDALMQLRRGGRFGTTQGTVLALKAITGYTLYLDHQKELSGELKLLVNGEQVLSQSVSSAMTKSLRFDELAQYFKPGENTVALSFEGMEEGLPYLLQIDWNTLTPNSSKEAMLQVNTSLAKKTVKLGETVRLTATVQNTDSKKDAPSAMAMIGIPAGLSLQPWQLKELLEKEKADFYEIKDNYLVLYYRQIKAGTQKTIHLDLKPELPGKYLAPASSTYLYYLDEHKHWTEGTRIEIES